MQRLRGQAIFETALFLPLALLTLFTVMWASQYGVMSERVQSAIRYSGLVSNQVDPFMQDSMYVLYNSLGASSTNPPLTAQTCDPPNVDALSNNDVSSGSAAPGSYPGPVSGTFWQATPAPPTLSCSSANTQTAAFTGLNQTALAMSNTPQITTGAVVPPYLQGLFGASSPTTASLNFMKPAGLTTILNCHPQLQSDIQASLGPTPPSSPVAPAALVEPIPSPAAIPETC